MQSIAIHLLVHLITIINVLGRQQFSYRSFCHQPDPERIQYKRISPEEDSNEWCVIVLDHEREYWKDVQSPSAIKAGAYVLNMTKLRAQCKRFSFTLVNVDLTMIDGPDSSLKLAIRKGIFEFDKNLSREHYYPFDCAYKPNNFDNDLVLACERGPLPDDHEYYFLYAPRDVPAPPGYFKVNRTEYWDEKNFKFNHYACYQKVQTKYPATSASIETSWWMISGLMFLSGSI